MDDLRSASTVGMVARDALCTSNLSKYSRGELSVYAHFLHPLLPLCLSLFFRAANLHTAMLERGARIEATAQS